jgi:hypothetical protein
MNFAIATGTKDIASLKTLKSQEPKLLDSADLDVKESLLERQSSRKY